MPTEFLPQSSPLRGLRILSLVTLNFLHQVRKKIKIICCHEIQK